MQLSGIDGVAAQVQEYLGSLAEALAGKVAGSVRDALAVGKELPTRRLARVISEQLDLQHMRVASSTELFLEHLRGKAHLVGEAALDHGRGVAIWLIQKMHVIRFDDQVVEIALTARGKLSMRTPFIDVGRATVPLGRLASGSWSQLSTPTLDKTRPLLAGTMESISTRGHKSSALAK